MRYLDLDCEEAGWKFTYGPSLTTDAYRANMFSVDRSSGSQITVLGGTDDTLSAWFFVFPVAQLNAIVIHVDVDGYFDCADLWPEAFQNASELRTIKVEFRYVGNLIRALHPRDGVIPAPNLIDITFDQTEFNRYDCSCENHFGMVKCLFHALAKRAGAGNTLSRLDLVECDNITEDDVVELSKVVG